MTNDWFSYLKVKPYQRLTSAWVNSLIDAINLTYDIVYTKSVGKLTKADLQALDVPLIPIEDNVLDLGSPSKRWKDLYAGSVIANYVTSPVINVLKAVVDTALLTYLDTDKLIADSANVNQLVAGVVKSIDVLANNVEANSLETGTLKANVGDIKDVIASKVSSDEMDAADAVISSLMASSASITSVLARRTDASELYADLGLVDELLSKSSIIYDLMVPTALNAYAISAEYASIGELSTHLANAERIESDYVTASLLRSSEAFTDALNANEVYATYVDTSMVRAEEAEIDSVYGVTIASDAVHASTVAASEVDAETIYASNNIFVDGKRVIKDDDPIHIYSFFPYAQSQMAESFYEALSRTPIIGLTVDENGNLYAVIAKFDSDANSELFSSFLNALESAGNLNALVDVAKKSYELEGSISSNTKELVQRAEQIVTNTELIYHVVSGPIGVIITKPITDGRIATDTAPLFSVVSATKTVTAAENTNGAELILDKGGRPIVNVYAETDNVADVYVYVSLDGETWRRLDSFTVYSGSPALRQYSAIAYPYVRVYVPTTGVGITIEIVASR